MKRLWHAHRVEPCKCDICHTAHVRRDIIKSIVYGLAGVGVVVAIWAALVLVLTGGPK